jgi:predicted nucleic acid-binding protein
VDAVELLRGDAPFVVDTSAWWRFSSLSGDLARLVRAAGDDYRMWITPIVPMEVLYSARSSTEYVELETDLDALRILRNDRAVTDAAMSAIGELAEHSDGSHRVPFTDALIAAAAAEHGLSRCSITTRTSTSSPKSSHSKASSYQNPDL